MVGSSYQLMGIILFTLLIIWLLKCCLDAQSKITDNFSSYTNVSNNDRNVEGFMEGMLSKNNVTSVKTRAETIDSEAKTIIGGMLINEGSNRRNFEELLLSLDKWCDAVVLSEIADSSIDGTTPYGDKTQAKIQQINNITKLKEAINNSVKFLDKQ